MMRALLWFAEWLRDVGLPALGAINIVIGAIAFPVGMLSGEYVMGAIGICHLAFGGLACPWARRALEAANDSADDGPL